VWTSLLNVAGQLLPGPERAAILADLGEESLGLSPDRRGRWVAGQALRIAGRYHLECYRDVDDRWRIVMLLGVACGLLWSVPAATTQAFEVADAVVSGATRALIDIWRASHLTAAVAVGLTVGRVTLVPSHGEVSRWHITLAALIVAIVLHGWARGAVAAVFLLAAALLGDRSRRAAAAHRVLLASTTAGHDRGTAT